MVLRNSGKEINEKLLPHFSPLGWEHINLTGDYIWQQNNIVEQGKFRPWKGFLRCSFCKNGAQFITTGYLQQCLSITSPPNLCYEIIPT
ncbi:hypothetical protein CEQ20_18515 [Yersinia pseudotuberculosis]|nr:hypothetical protein CEQ20_18515 [Yersinia pseudotuberculosis]AYX10831.1 hypothetical protein EGX52_08565 [Yersinia pseudotuberculosis]MBO1567207.1 Tn3 family transposase [Yersinia pseudotuberculosis]MBO1590570.1 Tn3 family transposase [Yersinia pseudotuberculosis]MBO1604066.1 Tn3 family transposase [Yersinia pseudotuberculosis]